MAAAGLKIVLPATFTDATLPLLRDDALLTTGSLVLLDGAHTANPLTAIPSLAGGAVPNIAWKECAATIGSGTQSTLACVLQKDANYTDGTDGKFELSTKGGIHGIVSITTQTANNHGMRLNAAQLIAAYLYANPAHEYFISQEISVTRLIPAGGGSETIMRIGDSGSLTKSLGSFVNGGSNVNNNVFNPVTGHVRPPLALNALGSQIRDGGFNAWVGAAPSPVAAASTQLTLAKWGRSGLESSGTNTYGSYILERVYLEDLTVSGRSWATVDALLAARNVADMATAGGKYFGDTYVTNPSTIA